ncbi:MAG: hypothetical protein F6K17_35675 [Okeania sp. SIO3C4]|nr:hypothetical protein [Okeania sp. SIO3C4]
MDPCGGASTPISPIAPHLRGVGSLFHVRYHSSINDPKPGENQLHWIQMVQANYGSFFPGLPTVVIDIPAKSRLAGTPYYDHPDFRFAGEDFLMDQPYTGG